MGDALGDSLVTNCPVKRLDFKERVINDQWKGGVIFTSIPWTLWTEFCSLPVEISVAINHLKKVSINVDYYPDTLNSAAHWIYEPDESISYHRMLLRSNFAAEARGFWTETNAVRSLTAEGSRFHNAFAYPVNTLGKPETVQLILDWGRRHGIVGLGRWGKWEHMNSDVAVEEALNTAYTFCHKTGQYENFSMPGRLE